MKRVAVFTLVLLAGCASWVDSTPDGVDGSRRWHYTGLVSECNLYPCVYVDYVPPDPTSTLYVIFDSSSARKCLVGLRPALPTDTVRRYRWEELPNEVR